MHLLVALLLSVLAFCPSEPHGMYLMQPAIINTMTRLTGKSLTDRAPDTLGVDFHKQILRPFSVDVHGRRFKLRYTTFVRVG